MRVSLFWRSGLLFLALLLAVLITVDVYVTRVLRRQTQEAEFDRLAVIAQIANANLPSVNDPQSLAVWLSKMASSGARISVIAGDGRVLADSVNDAETSQNQSDRAEFQQAMAQGEGRALRANPETDRDLLYLALRHRGVAAAPSALPSQNGSAFVVRVSLPVGAGGTPVAFAQLRFWPISLLLLLVTGSGVLLFSRGVSTRIRRLEEFSHRVARGDFRPLEMKSGGDELDDLARAVDETAARLAEIDSSAHRRAQPFAAILGSMIEGVAVISPQERVVFSNRAFSQILSLNAIPVEGRPLVEVVRQSDLLAVTKKVLAGHEQVSSEIVVGTVRPRSFSVTAVPVRATGSSGAILVLHDISELRRLERVRQDFVANVSHEFRTPLTAIQGFAETLLGGALEDPANRQHFVEIIRNHAARLARLTEDLLKLSRIEAGKLDLEFRPVSVYQLVQSCVETARFKAERKDLNVGSPPRGTAKCPGRFERPPGGTAESTRQCPPVHSSGRPPGSICCARGRQGQHNGVRHRHWNPASRAGANFRTLLSSRCGTFPRGGRHRPGPFDRPAHHGRPRRSPIGGQRSGGGVALPFQYPGRLIRIFPSIH